MTELFKLARPAADARRQIEEGTCRAYPALFAALATQGLAGLRAVAWPAQNVTLEIAPGSVWGIPVSTFVRRPGFTRTLGARGTARALIGVATVRAVTEFERLTESAPRRRTAGDVDPPPGPSALADLAPGQHARAARIARVRAQMTPVRRALEEREREERLRLKQLVRASHAVFTLASDAGSDDN